MEVVADKSVKQANSDREVRNRGLTDSHWLCYNGIDSKEMTTGADRCRRLGIDRQASAVV